MERQSGKVLVSILILVKNEAANLSRCLACVSWAHEIRKSVDVIAA
jgi:hypothetical protein